MKKLTALALIVVLAACGTTPVNQTSINTTKNPQTRANFAGAPEMTVIVENPHRQFISITEATGKKLTIIANYIQPESGEPSPDKALAILDSMLTTPLNDYETALVRQYRGYAYLYKEKYQDAITEFNLMLGKKDKIPVATEVITTKTLAQLYFATQNYDSTLTQMYKLPSLTEYIASSDYYLVSQAQEKTGDIQNAIINTNKAREMATSLSPKIRNNYANHLASLYEKNNEPLKAEDIRSQIKPLTPNQEKEYPVPILKAAPVYPAEALSQRIQGYCLVTFTVNERGSVEDAHVTPGDCKTLQGESGDIFAQASIDTVNKFKYRPIMENGKPVKFHGMRSKIVYEINE